MIYTQILQPTNVVITLNYEPALPKNKQYHKKNPTTIIGPECTANVYRQTTDKLMFKSFISTIR
jgi:hypothetical protein